MLNFILARRLMIELEALALEMSRSYAGSVRDPSIDIPDSEVSLSFIAQRMRLPTVNRVEQTVGGWMTPPTYEEYTVAAITVRTGKGEFNLRAINEPPRPQQVWYIGPNGRLWLRPRVYLTFLRRGRTELREALAAVGMKRRLLMV